MIDWLWLADFQKRIFRCKNAFWDWGWRARDEKVFCTLIKMNKLALIFLGLVLANAVYVKKSASDPNQAVFNQLAELEDKQIGRKLLDTIALQLKNQSPLGDIAKMLQNLRESLIMQQQDADLQHAADEAECEAEILGYNRRIDFASNEITDSTNEINSLNNQIANLESVIENANTQLDILNEQEQVLRDTRAADHAAFEERQQSTPKVIDALDVIASKLGAIQPESDADAVLAELRRIGSENPILALVQLASTFSAEKLQSVQDKIAELRGSLEQSIIDDQEEETQSQIDFQALILQFSEQREALSAERSDAQRKLETTQNQLASQKKRREDANRELLAATNGKTQKEAQCEGWRTAYADGTEQRAEEITIIRLIENILATKLEGARSYLQVR